MQSKLPEEITVDELKSSLDYYRGIIAGLGDSETDDFNRGVYYQHSGNLYIAIETIEKYRRYFEEMHRELNPVTQTAEHNTESVTYIPGKGATLHEGIEKEGGR